MEIVEGPNNLSENSTSAERNEAKHGPLVEDGAPYSDIGFDELKHAAQWIFPDWNPLLDLVTESIRARPFWQYEVGANASPRRRILGSIVLRTRADTGIMIYIRYLVLHGSYQWFIGRNVTNRCDILYAETNPLEIIESGNSRC